MARAAPQSQPRRQSSGGSRHSRQTSSSSVSTSDVTAGSGGKSSNRSKSTKSASADAGGSRKLTTTAAIPSLLTLPFVVISFLFSLLKFPFGGSSLGGESEDDEATMDDPEEILNAVLSERGLEKMEDDEYLSVPSSPALATLLDDALYRAYEAELVPTVSAASRLLSEFLAMKEAAALVLRECRWAAGVPFGDLEVVDWDSQGGGRQELAPGSTKNGVIFGGGAVVDRAGVPHDVMLAEGQGRSSASRLLVRRSPPSGASSSAIEQLHAAEMASWNEFDTIHDFAQQCYQSANEAIQRLTTDRLAETANRTLHDSLVGAEGDAATGPKGDALRQQPQPQSPAPPSSVSSILTLADAGIGRCYREQPRKDCWESPRLYCPDYHWADDAIGGCQRLVKALSKHRFVTLVAANGWDRMCPTKAKSATTSSGSAFIQAPTYASASPHVFSSLEAVHSLQYLVSELLASSVPGRLNQFRAATESNAVVSKRLYLVKCEYRAPLRALFESYEALNAAPKADLVERYLNEYHQGSAGESAGKGSGLRRKGSAESSKKSAVQHQKEKLEKVITEKYWKHPALVEALQLERCCERMEIEMSAMLRPLSNLAHEIVDGWKGRLRAVALVRRSSGQDPEEAGSGDEESERSRDKIRILLGWRDVPYMRELLRRLASILRRKPDDIEESTGIRPLLLDLQGVPRHQRDPIDSSIEMPFYPAERKPSASDDWFHLEQFLSAVRTLLELVDLDNTPFLVEDRTGSNPHILQDLAAQCREEWDEELFRAQFQDWFDLVKRQQGLNEDGEMTELSEALREAEIELSVAMASKDQLERVRKRLEALRADKEARYKVLRHIVFDLGYRELNDVIVVEPPADDATVEFPRLSVPGVFGDQLTMSGERLPVG
ncbi:hypothetical protein ACHAXT_011687 [Thalassiosira profunda]